MIDRTNILLSIVIPIYKVEQYIGKCLNSIYGQIDDLPVEVVLVNDGTPDKSMDVAQKFVNTKTVVISQENQGLSAARNNGMKASHGEYVWFVDSDDWIDENMYEILLQEIKTTTLKIPSTQKQ